MTKYLRDVGLTLVMVYGLASGSALGQSHMHMVKAPSLPKKEINYKDQLPSGVRRLVDKAFGRWNFQKYRADCVPETPPFSKCNLNGDSLPDYALDITAENDSALQEYFITFVSIDSGYTLFVLDTVSQEWVGNCYLEIFRAGTEFDDPPFQEEGDSQKSFATDCVSESLCSENGCTIFQYDKGKFRQASPCD
jgi:hypothetical protein